MHAQMRTTFIFRILLLISLLIFVIIGYSIQSITYSYRTGFGYNNENPSNISTKSNRSEMNEEHSFVFDDLSTMQGRATTTPTSNAASDTDSAKTNLSITSTTVDEILKSANSPSSDCKPASAPLGFQVVGYEYTHTNNCHHRLCELNDGRKKMNLLDEVENPCTRLSDCVTMIVKTSKRLLNTLNLVRSIRKKMSNVRIVIADDNHNVTLNEFKDLLDTDVNITYVQGSHGIGNGRNTALKLVTTEYFLLLDDDFQITEETNVRKMVDLLDKSDVTLVGGYVDKLGSFEGVHRVYTDANNRSQLVQYTGVAYETIPCFPSCAIVDIVKNIFLARTKDVLKAGAWNDKYEVIEHKDFFMKLRLAGMKVALCGDVTLIHNSVEGNQLRTDRMKVVDKFSKMFFEDWDIGELHMCGSTIYTNGKIC